MSTPSFAVIGAGIIGAAVARELLNRYPGAEVTVFEKASEPAAHQTGHNSGVVHAGLYYQPGSLKARMCRRGVDLLREFALEKGVPYEECGKLVVALEQSEEARLRAIHEKAVANGVPGVELLGPEGIAAIEPNARGRLALHSPHTAIIDYAAVARALLAEVRAAGGTVRFDTEVEDISNDAGRCGIRTWAGEEEFDIVVACAGLQSDRIARMAGGDRYPVIVPFFGQYSQLAPQHRDILNGLVYPVPDPAYPFLGVHLTKRVDGEMLVGPNAFLSFGRENYEGSRIGVRDSLAVSASPAFWRFAGRNMKAAGREAASVLSRRKFLAGAAAYVPSLEGAESRPITRGIRAQAMDARGELLDDFVIERVGRAVLLRNAPSPGATSSLAIAEHIVAQIADDRDLIPAS
ncbi:L-2-hydroxyglutarate oxidase [Rothia halotolerans]|uniref:L-2-hydroxyglutarate oxidase n=1 Tax=Rothia halotolerans TaxID=405770 RepID=UPI00101B74B0|nr:L-2-hydroxyglutarate oxidase [Rothia halotolerans]